MSRYLEILAVQRPFQFDVDANKRVMFSANYQALAAAPVADWEREVYKLINTAGLGTLGTDTFISAAETLPVGDGPYVQILDSGGRATDETHGAARYERLSVQIVVTAKDYLAGRTRALAIWRVLDGQRNITVAA